MALTTNKYLYTDDGGNSRNASLYCKDSHEPEGRFQITPGRSGEGVQ